jgi:hypothetical protein
MRSKKRFSVSPRAVRVGALAVLSASGLAQAGGTPENILLVINPSSQESMYLGNYYRFKRNIPEANVVYIDPGAPDYLALAGTNGGIDGVFGAIRGRRLDDHIDYIVVAGTDRFFVDAPGRVNDACWPVARFSQSGVFATAHVRAQLIAGNVPSTTGNGYYSANTSNPLGFDSNTAYLGGVPSTNVAARRYFIGAQLGYTGTLGNSLGEILQMIDRSVAADGTLPAGSFYYMNNLADPVRNIRACGSLSGCNGPTTLYTTAVNAILASGGTAEMISAILPAGRTNCLGIMTGAEAPNIAGETMTILPGAFCDHLTSWAATFDNPNQVKMSEWIRKGASATSGTVEEPCAYPGKFPHSTMHVNYRKGLSLGEAHLRSLAYLPLQQLLMGDPMTRPFTTFPQIAPNVPAGPVSGVLSFTPVAATTLPGAVVNRLELLIDGVVVQERNPGESFAYLTTSLADGPHDVRILAYDSTPQKSVGRWVGAIATANHGKSVSLNVSLPNAELTTALQPSITAGGGTIQEFRLLQNGRVIAANATGSPVQFYGRTLGAGRSSVQAEVLFTDGKVARSVPFEVNVAYAGGAATALPVAYSYRKRVDPGGPAVVELPATFPDNPSTVTYNVVSAPAQATIGGGGMNYRVITVPAGATGTDTLRFTVTNPSGTSATATVTLVYGEACYANCDGSTTAPVLNVADFTCFLQRFAAGESYANCDGSTTVPVLNVADFTCFLQRFATGCN